MSEDQALDVVGYVYDTVLNQELWPDALGRICDYVGGYHALLFHQDRALRSGDFMHSWNADPHWTRLYFEKYVGLNPAMPFTVLMDVGSVAALSRVLDMEEYKASVFYREWAEPQGYLDVCVAMLDKSGTAMGMIGVTRHDRDGPHTDENIARLKALTPHICRAVKLSRQFAALEAKLGIFSDAISALGDAVFVLDDQARVLFHNKAAQALLEVCPALTIASGQLLPQDVQAAASLRDALRAVRRRDMSMNGFARDLTLGTFENDRLFGQLLPLFEPSQKANGFSNAVAALFVRRVGPISQPPMEALATLYGLTPRELQVFLGIVQFGGVPEVAQMFGLKATTVRTHLQSLFEKTGVRRQADLAAIAATALGSLGPPPSA